MVSWRLSRCPHPIIDYGEVTHCTTSEVEIDFKICLLSYIVSRVDCEIIWQLSYILTKYELKLSFLVADGVFGDRWRLRDFDSIYVQFIAIATLPSFSGSVTLLLLPVLKIPVAMGNNSLSARNLDSETNNYWSYLMLCYYFWLWLMVSSLLRVLLWRY